ncbi:MAG: hypothetical protein ABFD97_15625 [Syntrophobacter sp.]
MDRAPGTSREQWLPSQKLIDNMKIGDQPFQEMWRFAGSSSIQPVLPIASTATPGVGTIGRTAGPTRGGELDV